MAVAVVGEGGGELVAHDADRTATAAKNATIGRDVRAEALGSGEVVGMSSNLRVALRRIDIPTPAMATA